MKQDDAIREIKEIIDHWLGSIGYVYLSVATFKRVLTEIREVINKHE